MEDDANNSSDDSEEDTSSLDDFIVNDRNDHSSKTKELFIQQSKHFQTAEANHLKNLVCNIKNRYKISNKEKGSEETSEDEGFVESDENDDDADRKVLRSTKVY